MRTGKFNTPVDVQQFAATPDGQGGNAKAWSTFATVYCEFAMVAGLEHFEGMRLLPKVTHVLHTHWQAGVTAKHRISYNARLFQIRAVVNVDERNQQMMLQVEEGVAT